MSALESRDLAKLTAETGIDPPDFPVVVRGYDRQRVDTYLERVLSRLVAAISDEEPTFEHLGAEAMKVLELAGKSAEVLIAQARERGEAIVEEARGQGADLLEQATKQAERLHGAARGTLREAADERDRLLTEANEEGKQMRALAEEEAQATLEEAQSASERMWQKVRDECATVLAETERLEKLRDRTTDYLGRVRSELNALFTGIPVDEADSEPDSDRAPEAADGADAEATPDSGAAGDTERAGSATAPAGQTGSGPVTSQAAK
jgi:cell division septum initiation protein DivIVA